MPQPPAPPADADVIIVGAGPAGMAAATVLADAGCKVIVLDMGSAPGGHSYRALEENAADPAQADLLAVLGPSYLAGLPVVRRFRAAASVDYRELTTVWEVRPDGAVGWLRGPKAGYLRGRYLVLANGGMERPTPFPGWTLPGVVTAGAVDTLLKAGRLKPAGRVVLAGTGPSILELADRLRRLGIKPALIAWTDQWPNRLKAVRHIRPSAVRPISQWLGKLLRLRGANVKLVAGVSRLEANGNGRVEAVSYSVGHRRFSCPCDLLVVHDGAVPSIDLAHGAGVAMEWDLANASWRPATAVDGRAFVVDEAGIVNPQSTIRIAGGARRVGGTDAAIADGRLAATAILADLNKAAPRAVNVAEVARNKAAALRPFLEAAFPPGLSVEHLDDQTIVCRCEELTAGVLRATISAGTRDINQLRGESRCGMGPCQGRYCMSTVARLIAANDGRPVSMPRPVFRARPPARPLPLGAFANLSGLDPEASTAPPGDKPDHLLEEADDAEER